MRVETQRSREGELFISRAALGLADIPARRDFGPVRFMSAREAERQGYLTINEI